MKIIAGEVNSILKNIFAKKHPVLGEIIVNWGAIVGDRFALKASPLKISSMREKGKKIDILYISVQNSSLALELSFQKEIIVERIAIYLGFKAIEDIRVVNKSTA